MTLKTKEHLTTHLGLSACQVLRAARGVQEREVLGNFFRMAITGSFSEEWVEGEEASQTITINSVESESVDKGLL